MNEIEQLEFEHMQHDLKQHALKILLNSGYGALGSSFFKFYDKDIAESITLTGQMLTAQTFRVLNQEMNKHDDNNQQDYIVFSDTDSAGVQLDQYIAKHELDISKRKDNNKLVQYVDTTLNNILTREFVKVAEKTNVFTQKIDYKREKIGKIITVAKKNYITLLINNEGVDLFDNPEMTMTGIDGVKSSISDWFKERLLKLYRLLLDEQIDEVYSHIRQTEQDFKTRFTNKENINKEFFNDLAKRSSVNNIEKYAHVEHKTVPYNVKASLFYNDLVKDDSSYTQIHSGDKILLLPLLKKNEYNQNYIAFFDDEFPLEHFNLTAIDTDDIINSQFREPTKRILSVLNREYSQKQDCINTVELF